MPNDLSSKVDVEEIVRRFDERSATIGIVGLGYVGLPLVLAAGNVGFSVVGVDIDPDKIDALLNGRSYIRHLPAEDFSPLIADGKFRPTVDFAQLTECDAVIVCVPTPLTRQREPDLSYVKGTAKSIQPHLRRGQLIAFESTTYPGTTDEEVKPILEMGGMKSGEDFFLAYSPEREDPGNPEFHTREIPKVVGGDGADALRIATALYGQIVIQTIGVSSIRAAEAVKITENVFRAVNIALVNELKLIYGAMGIDVWEVIDAAKSKPFGFMPFYPGPGLGGHCIPIDPFYLTWKAREYEMPTRFIELAGEINTAMPRHVVLQLAEALNARFAKGLNGARILSLGVAYKKNVDDLRESPALTIMELLTRRGARIDYSDPYVPAIPVTREHAKFAGMQSVALTPESIASYDAVLIATDHDNVDYAMIQANARLVVDTRNACARAGVTADNIVKA